MAQVLNYHDAVVYDTDVALFRDGGGWLNDNCVNWFFRMLEHEVFPGRADLLFMDPAVVSCMMNQCDERDEFVDLGRGIEVEKRTTVFVPINDASDRLSGGNHWSLLVFERETDGTTPYFRHFDSSKNNNRVPAERTAAQFMRLFDGTGRKTPPRVDHVGETPQQQNGYDCGMYMVLLAERLAWKTVVVPVAPRLLNTGEAVVVGVAGRGDDGRGEHGGGVSSNARCHEAATENDGDGGGVGILRMSPEFVSSARAVARERLERCIESGRVTV